MLQNEYAGTVSTGINWPPRGRPGVALAAPADPLLDEAALGELDKLGPDVLTTILGLYSTQTVEDSAELAAAAGEVDMPKMGRAAHRLRGASSVVGAAQVAGIAREIETSAIAGCTPAALLMELAAALDHTKEAFRDRIASLQTTPTQVTP